MTIKIGADEIILWLRKNGKAAGRPNDKLGNDISVLIQKQLGGSLDVYDQDVYWQAADGSKNVGEFKLPKTAAQYSLDTSALTALYNTIDTW